MPSHLTPEEQSQLSARADQFHAALARGGVSDWKPFLDALPERVRSALLPELVIIDLIHRWGHGERPEIEDYIRRFPEFGPLDRVPTEVIVEECRCRVKAGEHFDSTAYRRRFPTQFSAIRNQLEGIRATLRSGPGAGTVVTPDQGAAEASKNDPMSGASEYQFVRELGRGNFGVVWLARRQRSGIEKAIKILRRNADPGAADRELRALELIKNFRHPYLLATEDFWEAGGHLYIVMELADGTLRSRLKRCIADELDGIPAGELLGYLWEAAEALDYLHRKKVVHRDVKPDNLLLLNGHVKVADFGLARAQENQIDVMKTFAGTPAYMAPEVWGKDVGPASDQYSLAFAYAELRQGTPPLMGSNIQEMMLAHLDGALELKDFIGPEERRVLKRAMARRPEDRYPSCIDFVMDLSAVLGGRNTPQNVHIPPSELFHTPISQATTERPVTPRLGSDPEVSSIVAELESESPTHPENDAGTVVNTPPVPQRYPAHAPPPPVVPLWKRLLAVVLTLTLLACIGGVIWFLTRNGDPANTVTSPETKPEDKGDHKQNGKGNGNGKTDTEILPTKAFRLPESKLVVLADGRRVFDVVGMQVGKESVRFRLIAGGNGISPVHPFYIMESKLSNDLYRAGGATPSAVSENNGELAPVTDVTAEEAERFAQSAFGGHLPTPAQWDHAAGLYAGLERPEVTRPSGRPRVLLKKPEPTHGPDAGSDVNEFGLIDMAGNGREWTRLTLPKPGESAKEVGTTPLSATDLVVLRGRNFTLSRGLTFAALREEQTTPQTQTQFATARSPYTSFRVVLPLP